MNGATGQFLVSQIRFRVPVLPRLLRVLSFDDALDCEEQLPTQTGLPRLPRLLDCLDNCSPVVVIGTEMEPLGEIRTVKIRTVRVGLAERSKRKESRLIHSVAPGATVLEGEVAAKPGQEPGVRSSS